MKPADLPDVVAEFLTHPRTEPSMWCLWCHNKITQHRKTCVLRKLKEAWLRAKKESK